MNSTTNLYNDYVFGQSDDRDRLTLQHQCFKPNFVHKLNLILDEYGLGERISKAQAKGEKIRVLEVGCGEGLYLHDLAATLEERGWLEAVEFYATDSDPKSVASAREYSQHSNPPRPYFNFYVHDLTAPLEECTALAAEIEEPLQFDFIMAHLVMEHIPNARHSIELCYRALKPGGVIFLRDTVTTMNEQGWKAFHPAIEPFTQPGFKFVAATNGGIDVANETAPWLLAMQATQVRAYPDPMVVGGETELGLLMLRNVLLIVKNAAPALIGRGFATQAQYDEAMATVGRELGPLHKGQMTFIDTLARKPA